MNAFRVLVTDEALRRQMEKEQIRREIIAGEIARRRELEEEVRREMAMERALGIPAQRYLATPNLFQERVNPFAVDDNTNSIIGVETKPSSSSSSSQINKDKVIMLPRPDPDLHIAKRKAATPDLHIGLLDKANPNLYSAKQKAEALVVCGTEPSEFVMKKKLKGEWSCPLCQISATNERGLKEHMNGRKHKKKEVALRTLIIVKSTETSLLSKENEKGVKTTQTSGDINGMMVDDSIGASQLQLPQIVTPVEIKPPQIDKDKAIILAKCDPDLHNGKGKAVVPAVNTTKSSEFNLIIKPKEEWSCAICRISTTSKRNLSDHLHSRKHKAKEAALRNQEVLKSSEASMSLKGSEKCVKTTEIILIPTPGLDAKALEQFPQPSMTLEELNHTTIDRTGVESDGILADSSPKESSV